MDVEPIALPSLLPRQAQLRQGNGLPKVWHHLPPAAGAFSIPTLTLIGDSQVIDCLDVRRLPEVLDRGDEPLCPGVQQVPRLLFLVRLAPLLGLGVLARSVPGGFRKRDQPGRPPAVDDSPEYALQLGPVLGPVAADERHAHGPEAPAEKGDGPELPLGEPPASAQHAATKGKCLNHVKVSPADVVGHHNGALPPGQGVPRDGNVGAVAGLEGVLDPTPYGVSKA